MSSSSDTVVHRPSTGKESPRRGPVTKQQPGSATTRHHNHRTDNPQFWIQRTQDFITSSKATELDDAPPSSKMVPSSVPSHISSSSSRSSSADLPAELEEQQQEESEEIATMLSNLPMPSSNSSSSSKKLRILTQELALVESQTSNSIASFSTRNTSLRSYDSFNNVSESNRRDKSLRSVATAATYDLTPSPFTTNNLDNHNKKISIERFPRGFGTTFDPPLTTMKRKDESSSGSDSFMTGDDSIDTFSFEDTDDDDDDEGDAVMFDVTMLPRTNTPTVTRMNVTKALRGVIRQEYCARTHGLDPILLPVPGTPPYMRSLRTTDMVQVAPPGSASSSTAAASSSARRQGTFTTFSEILFLGRRNKTTDIQPQPPQQQQQQQQLQYLRPVHQQRYYACKSLNATGVGASPMSFIHGVALLAYEARVLSSLQHPNVIQIYGWGNTKNATTAVSSSRLTGFFFLQDQIVETLDERITHWSTTTPCDGLTSASTTLDVASWSNYPREPSPRRGTLRDHFAYHFRQIEKYCLCQDLLAALQYIHNKQIVYTNVSPRTIGFVARKTQSTSPLGGVGRCSTETLKLIDFESSHTMEYGRNHNNTNNTMLATVAGNNNNNTYNYMSPEVYRSNNFSTNKNKTINSTIPTKTQITSTIDERCDVYSFALVCWTIFSHQIPFAHLTTPAFEEFVVDGDFRPVKNPADHNSCDDHPPLFQNFQEWLSVEETLQQQVYLRSNPQNNPHENENDTKNKDDNNATASMDVEDSGTLKQRPPTWKSFGAAAATTGIPKKVRPGKVPDDLYKLLAKCWQATPSSRMGWEEIKIHFMLLRQIEELTLQDKTPPTITSRAA